MRKLENLKSIWADYDTLLEAFELCKIGKSFRDYVISYEMKLATNLMELQAKLESGTYAPKPMREFFIFEPKVRLIQAPYFEDRIVHHALLIAIQRHVERKFYRHSYACQKGKGVHAASLQLASWVRNPEMQYYLKLDISKFFYSIDHGKLETIIGKYIGCEETKQLLALFYRSETGVGLPLGNVTSQLLSNLFLSPLDNFVKRELKAKRYIRYMDDFIILGSSRETLKDYKPMIEEFLGGWNLKLNSKYRLEKIAKGIDFCGYRHWPRKRLLRKKTLFKFSRCAKMNLEKSVASYLGAGKNTQSFRWITEFIGAVCCPEIKGNTHKFIMKHGKKK